MKRSEAEQALIKVMMVLREKEDKALLDRVNHTLLQLKSMYKKPDDDISADFATLLVYYEKQKAEIEKHHVEQRRKVAHDLFDEAINNPGEAPLSGDKPVQPVGPSRADAKSSSTAMILGKTVDPHHERQPLIPSMDAFKETIKAMLSGDYAESRYATVEFKRYVDMVRDVGVLEEIRDAFYGQLMEGARNELKRNKEAQPKYEAEKKKYLKDGGNEAFQSLQEKIKEKNGRVLEYVPEKAAKLDLERKKSSDELKVIVPEKAKTSHNPFRRKH